MFKYYLDQYITYKAVAAAATETIRDDDPAAAGQASVE